MTHARTYRFAITVTAEPEQESYNDPEWIVGAAWGALAHEYGYACSFDNIEEIGDSGSP